MKRKKLPFYDEALAHCYDRMWEEESLLDYYPQRVNDGWCDEFADFIVTRLPDAERVDFTGCVSDERQHSWIEYKDRVYDAEHPFGVSDYKKLRFFS